MNLPTWALIAIAIVGPTGIGAVVAAWVLGGRKQAAAANAKTRADTAKIAAETAQVVAETQGQVAATADKLAEASGAVVQLMRQQIDDLSARLVAAEKVGLANRAAIDEGRKAAESLHQRDALIVQLREVIDAWTQWAREYQPWAEMATTAMRSSMINAPWPPKLPNIPDPPLGHFALPAVSLIEAHGLTAERTTRTEP